MAEIFWGYWRDYPKVVAGKTYAKVGERLYTKHAVDYLLPSGRRVSIQKVPTSREDGGRLTDGRGIPPRFVEEAILFGKTELQIVNHVPRTVHKLGDIRVVTEDNGKIVVTVNYSHT